MWRKSLLVTEQRVREKLRVSFTLVQFTSLSEVRKWLEGGTKTNKRSENCHCFSSAQFTNTNVKC